MRDVAAASPTAIVSTGATKKVWMAVPLAASKASSSNTGEVVSRPRTPRADAVTCTQASAGSECGAKVRVTPPTVTVPPVAADTRTEPAGGLKAGPGAGSPSGGSGAAAVASSVTETVAPGPEVTGP